MSSIEEILPGVYGVAVGSIVNAFVLAEDLTTLIDTGTPKGADAVAAALHELRRDRVDGVALTHHHPDHRGGLAAVAGGAPVYVHRLDADVVDGRRPQPGPSVKGAQKVLITLAGPVVKAVTGKPQPVAVAKELEDGDDLPGGLRAIHTPGHTAGHVSFLHAGKRLLFVGDAAQNRSSLALPVPFFTEDMEQAKRTLSKIAALDFDTAVFGHGTVLRGKANAEFRKLVDANAS
jgi:glyoxylase-like metal-dependent hydrolase (beta-lactamase superfamily II)